MHKAPSAAPQPYALDDFDFELPDELIAQHPAPERSASRLLLGTSSTPVDLAFLDLPHQLQPGDLLVFNDTKVIPARLFGEKPSGGKVELLIERVLGGQEVAAHMRVSKKPQAGVSLLLHPAAGSVDQPRAKLLGRWPDEQGTLFKFALSNNLGEDPYQIMARHGHVPLPPYIKHADSPQDLQRYQTVFAKNPGAVAAPTAALHFDEQVFKALSERGIQSTHITLHVGAGTFAPVKTQNLSEHKMHSEWFNMPVAAQQAILACRARGGRVVAVGTTAVRTLESWAQRGGLRTSNEALTDCSGETNIFITPGFQFQVVDQLVTNFHLPKSTLMMLISAFAGHAHVKALYRHAIAQRYRFFSYGDSMLLARTVQGPV